jgi:uncharacterized damage-inducible protein DinB
MTNWNPGHPEPSEYPPYASIYVDLVPDGDILRLLATQVEDTVALLQPIEEHSAGELRYAPGKWTVKQVLGHVVDTERIFTYRALRTARGDATPMPGFEQDDYIRLGPFDHCSLADLLDEFRIVRAASITLYRKLTPESWMRRGVANQFPVTVRGLAYLTAGHELHHVKILRERYLA